MVIRALFLFLLIPFTALGQPLGPSYLGMCSPAFPCGRAMRVYDGLETKVGGWLVGTFGDECPCSQKFLGLPGKKFVRVHLANCTCFPERGRRCLVGEPFRGETIRSADKKLVQRNRALLKRYNRSLQIAKRQLSIADKDTTVVLSLCLETVLSMRARSVMLREARKVFPDGVFVDNPVAGPCMPGLICEKHGVNPSLRAPCVSDTDGSDWREEFPVLKPQCMAQYLWEPKFNLINPTFKGFQPPRERSNAPTVRDFRRVREAIINRR